MIFDFALRIIRASFKTQQVWVFRGLRNSLIVAYLMHILKRVCKFFNRWVLKKWLNYTRLAYREAMALVIGSRYWPFLCQIWRISIAGEYKWGVWVINNSIQFSSDSIVVIETSLAIFYVSTYHNYYYYFKYSYLNGILHNCYIYYIINFISYLYTFHAFIFLKKKKKNISCIYEKYLSYL